MDICEYAEKVFDMKLLDYQKTMLKQIHESYKENKPLRFIPPGRGSRVDHIMLALQMRAIAEMYEKEETDA